MTKTLARTYTLCLYCGYDDKTEGLFLQLGKEKEFEKCFMDERDHIDEIMETLGSGAQYQGSAGSTTTWIVREESMLQLLREIQEYNNKKEYLHIIHMQVY